MLPQTPRSRKVVLAFWVMAFLAIGIWAMFGAGWDVAVYETAIRSLKAGHDPYADAIAKQTAYREQLLLHPDAASDPPYSYVYSPITLPLLSLIGKIPPGVSGATYWVIYAVGAFAMLWAGMQAVEEKERPYLAFFAPVAVFFPAFLENGVILSGNIAYIVYGATLPAAVIGWKKGRWRWFYLAVLVASCFKAPYLTLLAIPVLSQRNQWVPAALTAGAGVVLFAAQPILWPVLFQHFTQAIDLQMRNFRDFGCSPAGIFASYLLDFGLDSSRGGFILYILYAVPLFCFLVHLSRRFLSGAFSLTRWIPVLLLGVVLLAPRIQEYDLAILALPMALIVWRFLPRLREKSRTRAGIIIGFIVLNAAAAVSWVAWKDIACALLVSLFFLGARQLLLLGSFSADSRSGFTLTTPL